MPFARHARSCLRVVSTVYVVWRLFNAHTSQSNELSDPEPGVDRCGTMWTRERQDEGVPTRQDMAISDETWTKEGCTSERLQISVEVEPAHQCNRRTWARSSWLWVLTLNNRLMSDSLVPHPRPHILMLEVLGPSTYMYIHIIHTTYNAMTRCQ